MHAKILVICTLALLVVATNGRGDQRDRMLCQRLDNRCTANSASIGNRDDGVDALNEQCLLMVGTSWRNITRCQLVHATCQLSLIVCGKWTCNNVAKVLQLR